jgi:Bacterial Ig-like domain
VDTCEAPTTLSNEGANKSVTGNVTDRAGNTASTTENNINIDKTAPVVSSTSPARDATGVSATAKIRATFSESGAGIDPGTLSTNTFRVVQVKPTGNVSVSGTVNYDESTKTVTFTPDKNVAKGAYQVTITTGVEDKADNPLANDYTWQFFTAGPSSPRR